MVEANQIHCTVLSRIYTVNGPGDCGVSYKVQHKHTVNKLQYIEHEKFVERSPKPITPTLYLTYIELFSGGVKVAFGLGKGWVKVRQCASGAGRSSNRHIGVPVHR